MELWHVLNRGVEKRNIFLDDRDRFRFVHGLMIFNTKRHANNTTYLLAEKHNDLRGRYDATERIVDIHGWCLMKNHFHMLLSEKVEGGISLFLQKLNVGYAKYFNDRYEREGGLFQSRTKKVLIDNDAHFLHILNYIHLNPLDADKENRRWRGGEVTNMPRAISHLGKYRWSSYLDYYGRNNFPGVATTEFFGRIFKNVKSATEKYMRDIQIEPAYMLE